MRHSRYVHGVLLILLLVGCTAGLPFSLGQRPTATPNPDVQKALEIMKVFGQVEQQRGGEFEVGVFAHPIDVERLKNMIARGRLLVGIYVRDDNAGGIVFSNFPTPETKFKLLSAPVLNEKTQEIGIMYTEGVLFVHASILEGMPYLSQWIGPANKTSRRPTVYPRKLASVSCIVS